MIKVESLKIFSELLKMHPPAYVEVVHENITFKPNAISLHNRK